MVIDEFHHAEAQTYRRILDHLAPRELLGLTATPERADGIDVRSFFDGRTAAELRLWDALGADLLCPFHYFAVADGTDLRGIAWARGRYDEDELSNVYTGNQARAAIVLSELRDKVLDPGAMRALGFCVERRARRVHGRNASTRPASRPGPSAARRRRATVSGRCRTCEDRRVNVALRRRPLQRGPRPPRRRHRPVPPPHRERHGLPPAARPRASPHSGQGSAHGARLRRLPPQGVPLRPEAARADRPDTSRARARHRDAAFRSCLLAARSSWTSSRRRSCWRTSVRRSPTAGSRSLPNSARTATTTSAPSLTSPGSSCRTSSAAAVIRGRGSGGMRGCRRAPARSSRRGCSSESAPSRTSTTAHRAVAYARSAADDAPAYDDLPPTEQQFARMLFFSMWPDGGGHARTTRGSPPFDARQATRDEAPPWSTCPSMQRATRPSPSAVLSPTCHCGCTLATSAKRCWRRSTTPRCLANRTRFREGVLYVPERNVDAFFVTLKKSEADYSPTTMYRDYPISRDPLSLGVAVDDIRGLDDRSALPATARARCCSSYASSRRTTSERRLTSSSGRRRTSHIRASGRSRSPGNSSTPMPTDFFTTATVAAS